jgi:hypothetical protein
VLKDEQFDFLNEIVGKVPDAPAPSKGGMSGGGEGDSDDGDVKKKRGGRKRKKEADDYWTRDFCRESAFLAICHDDMYEL